MEKYKNQMPYPSELDFKTFHIYKDGKVLGKNVSVLDKNRLVFENPGALVEQDFDNSGYLEAIKAYKEEDARLLQLFWDDLAEEHGVTHNPKRSMLEGIAWENGHSSGLGEVANVYEKLVDLIK